ncbi:MAG: PilT/PilU family type 4a pilus ATPase [Planctomycetota bacterium]|nr:PilT/PilU family type 4a pilus ATPase [Planctomycetota bacterium]
MTPSPNSPGNDPGSAARTPRGAWEPPPWEANSPRRPGEAAPLPTRSIPLKPEGEGSGAPGTMAQPGRSTPPTQFQPQPAAPAQPQGNPNAAPRSLPPLAPPPFQQPPPQAPAQQAPPPPAYAPRAYPPPPVSAPPVAPALQPESAAPLQVTPIAGTPPLSAQPPALEPEPLRESEAPSLEAAEASRFNSLPPRHKVEAWLAVMVKAGASDLILRAGGRPSTRIDGRIGFLPGRVPNAGALLEVLEGVMGSERMETWRKTGSVDAALQLDGLGRFRLNAYKQMGEPAVVVRRISENAPDLEKLELPTADLSKIAQRKRGLVLVTGIAGSGKSTTLAAMIEMMNRNADRHVITLEDPIEVLFSEKRCVISQREVGIDCSSFHDGLRHALRQSPDVIQIGEMRDRETVGAALDAAETGHLVMSTLHTVNAAQTIDRILGFFPAEQHSQVRTRLSDNLACVLSQRLIPRASGKGMVPAFELLVQTPRVRELIDNGETGELMRTIEQGATPGLISFNQSLRRLVQASLVELKDALAASDRPEELVLALRGITSSSGRNRGEG